MTISMMEKGISDSHRILVAGHTCVDFFPAMFSEPTIEEGRTFSVGAANQRPGGVVPNTGSALSRLGVRTDVQVVLGDDLFGNYCSQWLCDNISGDVHIAPARSGTSYTIVIEPPGKDRAFWHYQGSNGEFAAKFDISGISCVHVGYPPLIPELWNNDGAALATAFAEARAHGVTTSLDLAVVPPDTPAAAVDWDRWFTAVLPNVDIITPSWDDVSSALGLPPEPDRQAIGAAAEDFIERGVAIVLLSAGSLGFYIATADGERFAQAGSLTQGLCETWSNIRMWVPARQLSSILTATGAGDHLTAALLSALCRGLDPAATVSHMNSVIGQYLQGLPLEPAPHSSPSKVA